VSDDIRQARTRYEQNRPALRHSLTTPLAVSRWDTTRILHASNGTRVDVGPIRNPEMPVAGVAVTTHNTSVWMTREQWAQFATEVEACFVESERVERDAS
jgi:hypothetical protein